MAVGASIGNRLTHLIHRKGISDSELAKVLHINRSTLSRIIKGETEKVPSQMIIDAAQYFGVSTDFLLGLTDMPDPMNHPVESFGLTEAAAKAILSEDVHIEMLNRLLENRRFCQLTQTMAYALEPVFGPGGNDHLEPNENNQFESIRNRQQPRLVLDFTVWVSQKRLAL